MASGIGGVNTLLDNYDVAQGEGTPPGLPPRGADADAQRPGRATSACYVGARAAVNTPVSACASGNEAIALAVDQIRLGRADVVAGRRHRGGDPPAADGGLRQHDGAVEERRRPGHGLPALGHRPRRLRARRGRRRARARVRGARPGARRPDLRRGARRRHHRRLPRHRPARPRRSRRLPGDPAGARGVRDRPRRDRPRQRPRDVDPAGRHRRGPDAPRHARARTRPRSSSPAPSR